MGIVSQSVLFQAPAKDNFVRHGTSAASGLGGGGYLYTYLYKRYTNLHIDTDRHRWRNLRMSWELMLVNANLLKKVTKIRNKPITSTALKTNTSMHDLLNRLIRLCGQYNGDVYKT